MRTTKLIAVLLVTLLAGTINAQVDYKIQKVTSNRLVDIFGQNAVPVLSPTVGNPYGNAYAWLIEDPVTGAGVASGLSWQGDLVDSTMDGDAEVRGGDFADFVDENFPQNDVETDEVLCFLEVDAGTGRNILRLTTQWRTTADPNGMQWDSYDMDLQDPLDLDMDGETGAGPDGMFGTEDDVEEPDGFLDTGDGVLDAPMPLDPPSLVVFLIDNDGDGDNMNDPPSNTTAPVYVIGSSFGLTAITFDAGTGPVDVQAIYWKMQDYAGGFADLDRDGNPGVGAFTGDFDSDGDGTFDSIRTDLIVPPDTDPLGGTGWVGQYGLQFGNDGDGRTTNELMSGTMQNVGYIVDYLSDIKNEFGKDAVLCGDVNLDGEVNILDVAPFVTLITENIFQAEGDINGDGEVNILDVAGFVDKLTGG